MASVEKTSSEPMSLGLAPSLQFKKKMLEPSLVVCELKCLRNLLGKKTVSGSAFTTQSCLRCRGSPVTNCQAFKKTSTFFQALAAFPASGTCILASVQSPPKVRSPLRLKAVNSLQANMPMRSRNCSFTSDTSGPGMCATVKQKSDGQPQVVEVVTVVGGLVVVTVVVTKGWHGSAVPREEEQMASQRPCAPAPTLEAPAASRRRLPSCKKHPSGQSASPCICSTVVFSSPNATAAALQVSTSMIG
mmetsp:Transcript_117314/g.378610  ORF Transcript_117314/g.378610 Transcript_117314/m.378610 type:complete len:246 (-) Transcript_117314:778-1515(-)